MPDPAQVEIAVTAVQGMATGGGAALDERAARQAAVARDPLAADAQFAFGAWLQASGEEAAGLGAIRRGLALSPSVAAGWNNLGVAATLGGRHSAALRSLRRALAAAPDSGESWNNLGNALLKTADTAKAVACYRNAVRLDPGLRPAQSNLINALRLIDGVSAEDELAACRGFVARFAPRPAASLPARPREAGGRLRIGYVGADALRRHTASVSLLPLVEAHDRDAVEPILYSDLPPAQEDDISRRYRAVAPVVATEGLSDEALAARLRADGIDIAVDVIGYPRGSRLGALAYRPAPVQVNLLLMGSFGMEAVGWAIGDVLLTPPGTERLFTERLLRIDLAFVYRPFIATPDVRIAAERSDIVFGSLNQPAKLSPRCIAVWSRLLARLPGSRLILKGQAYSDAIVAGRLRAAFAAHGVEGRRLELRGWAATQEGHLGAYGDIDIALDPFPYGGVITTCEAMWMGVPVVSLIGDRVLGRYGGAFLRTVGLGDLAVADEDAYVETALALASDRARLRELRRTLRQTMTASRLCDGAAFARAVEGAYLEMWRAQATA